jgi:hypothetical protein
MSGAEVAMTAPRARRDRNSFFIGSSDASGKPFIRDRLRPEHTVGADPDGAGQGHLRRRRDLSGRDPSTCRKVH